MSVGFENARFAASVHKSASDHGRARHGVGANAATAVIAFRLENDREIVRVASVFGKRGPADRLAACAAPIDASPIICPSTSPASARRKILRI